MQKINFIIKNKMRINKMIKKFRMGFYFFVIVSLISRCLFAEEVNSIPFTCIKRQYNYGSSDNESVTKRDLYVLDLTKSIDADQKLLDDTTGFNNHFEVKLLEFVNKAICIADYTDASEYFDFLNDFIIKYSPNKLFQDSYIKILNNLSREDKAILDKNLKLAESSASEVPKP